MNEAKKKTRRRHSVELKQQIIARCAEPGASVASIALSYGINANVVHKWRREAGGALPALQAPAFVPVPLPPAACSYARGEPILRMTGVDGQHASAGFALP